jgi:uncharacterized protein (DUF433 family)
MDQERHDQLGEVSRIPAAWRWQPVAGRSPEGRAVPLGTNLRYDAGGPGGGRMPRLANHHARISVRPEVLGGKPCIKGTRVPVDLILRYLGDGQGVGDTLRAFPGVTREDVQAAETFALPTELLEAVVAHFDPVQVILFGSRARGEAGPDRDIDLLVVLDDHTPAERLGWRSAFEARKDFHRAVDIIPCRQRWFEDKRRVIGSLAHMAAEDGVVVYERA